MKSSVVPSVKRAIERSGSDPSMIRGVPIRECREPLLELKEERRIFVAPAYFARGIPSAPNRIVVRQGVLKGLRRAAASLPPGIELLLWDGLRMLETQREIVEEFRDSLPEAGREETVEKYLAQPPACEEEFRRNPPPHTTGGAIDLTLCDSSGRPLDMGADFDEFDETAWLAYFEDGSDGELSPATDYQNRRRILYWAMIEAGFAPYPWEYWHYELGTMVAAVFYDLPFAKYGVAVPWVASR